MMRLLLLITMLEAVCGGQVIKDTPRNSADNKSHIRRVFLNVTGDAKLSRRFWSYFGFEIDDFGISLATTEVEADAVVSVQLTTENTTASLASGLIQVHATAGEKSKNLDICASTSTDPSTADLFSGSAENSADQIHESFPKLERVRLDATSDFSDFPKFKGALIESLRSKGYNVVDSGAADLLLRVVLVRLKPLVDETVLHYKFSAASRDGKIDKNEMSDAVIRAKLKQSDACNPESRNLDWFVHDDVLYRLARNAAKDLDRANRGESD